MDPKKPLVCKVTLWVTNGISDFGNNVLNPTVLFYLAIINSNAFPEISIELNQSSYNILYYVGRDAKYLY